MSATDPLEAIEALCAEVASRYMSLTPEQSALIGNAPILVEVAEVEVALAQARADLAEHDRQVLREAADALQASEDLCDGNYNPLVCQTCRAIEALRDRADAAGGTR